ncbi:MAG: MFS transporter [Bifidobacterium sp.]|nr:MFS transporter [Bifidobacterium sp.]
MSDSQAINPHNAQAPASSLASLAAVDTAVPDEASAFMDMRDPMVSADGHRPTKAEIVRLGIGFTVSAVACAIPWVALSSIILPRVFEQIDPAGKVAMIGVVNAAGSVVALVANIVFGTLSDMTRSRFGKRTPWIVIGGLVTGLCIGAIAFTRSEGAIVALWCCAQFGYNMMLAPYVATMSDRVPDKVRGTISGFYGAGIAVGQTLGSFVGAQLLQQGQGGIFAGWMMGLGVFSLTGIFVVAVWPRERSNRDEARGEVTARAVLANFRPPRHAPDFYHALVGRTLMMGGYWMITTYQLYIAQDYILAGQPNAVDRAAGIIATMSVITLVVSLVAAVTAGPITDRLGMRKVPVALASCLFAVGAAMPLLFRSPVGMYLFAGIAGLGYGVYNAIDQALNVAVLPDPKEAGKDLGILNLANTLSTVIGAALTTLVVSVTRAVTGATGAVTPPSAYAAVFVVAIVIVLIAAALIMRIKHVK